MASLAGTIGVLRLEALATINDILRTVAEMPELTAEQEVIVEEYLVIRGRILDSIDNPVYSIAEIRAAKLNKKKSKFTNKDRRF